MFRSLFKRKNKGEPKIDHLIVGLGNPGEKYKKTAHNAGFRILSHLKEISLLPDFSKDNTLNSLVSKGEIEGKKVALILPLTFMNLSGEAVRRAIKNYSISPNNLILVHDDTDLEAGTMRFSSSSGSAGHKGVSSVIKAIKTKDFMRLRFGVSKKMGKSNEKALNIVLKNIPEEITDMEKRGAEELKKSILYGFSQKTIKVNPKKQKSGRTASF